MSTINKISIQHLVHLEALVHERHVTRAAERIGIGQPTMSSSLAKLRKLFKDPLLVKTRNGMEPTPRALELTHRIRDMIDLLEGRGATDARFNPLTSERRFRIMASDGIARIILPELMRLAKDTAPRVQFMVHPGDVRRTAEYLRDGDFDLVVAFLRQPAQELHQTQLYPQRLVCIARQGHPVLKGRLTLKQFAALSHAVWGAPPVPYPTLEVMVDEALEKSNLTRQVALRVSSVMLLGEVVAKSDLLAIIPEPLALTSRQTLPIQIFPLPFQVAKADVSMLWHDRLHQDAGHKWLRSTMRAIGKKRSAGLSVMMEG